MASHRSGNLQQAAQCYEKLLALSPADFDCLHLSGVLCYQSGHLTEAQRRIRKAIEVNPCVADAHSNLGLVLHDLGRPEEALSCFDTAIALQVDHAQAHSNRGFTLMALGLLAEAAQALETATRLNPALPQAHLNLGRVWMRMKQPQPAIDAFDRTLHQLPDHADAHLHKGDALRELNRHAEALQSYDHVLNLRPDRADAHCNRGIALQQLKRSEEAAQSFRTALQLDPLMVEARCNLGAALQVLKRHKEALGEYDAALRQNPGIAVAHCNRGTALLELGALADAVASYESAIALQPEYAEAWSNRGGVLHKLGRFEEALASYEQALAVRADYASAYWNKAITLLLLGRLSEGWDCYEWRWRWSDFPSPLRAFRQPQWTGRESIAGATVLLHAEQGLGDTIQFSRYAAVLRDKGAHVLLEVQRPLVRIMQTLPGVDLLMAAGDELPAFDMHCPLGSVPLALGTQLDTIPSSVPYLHPDPARVQRWASVLGNHGLRVCICWQGKQGRIDQGRSFPVDLFESLGALPGVRLISVHKGAGEAQLAHLPAGMTVQTLGSEFDHDAAFLDSAAVMRHSHLVITSDTAVAHLAGALGVPVWVALKRVPDWRWLLGRTDSPWYSTMRLFRQKVDGDWQAVFREMTVALRQQIDAGGPGAKAFPVGGTVVFG